MLFFGTTIDGLQMGLCFAVLALGMYISYTILDFPDLSMDGTFPLGGVVATVVMLRLGVPPVLALVVAFVAGALAGMVTGLLHVKLKITPLLSAIIVMTGLLSVTLALTKLLTKNGYTTTIFSYRSENLHGMFDLRLPEGSSAYLKDLAIIGLLLLVVVLVKVAIDLFLRTRLGYMLWASGSNGHVVISLGKDVGTYKIIGLCLANGLAATSGALYSQLFMSYDNTSGSGKVVLALASVIIGLALFSKARHAKATTAVIVGAIIYSLCLNYLVLVDSDGIYLKLLNAVLFTLILVCNHRLSRWFSRVRVPAVDVSTGGKTAATGTEPSSAESVSPSELQSTEEGGPQA